VLKAMINVVGSRHKGESMRWFLTSFGEGVKGRSTAGAFPSPPPVSSQGGFSIDNHYSRRRTIDFDLIGQ
jgi:hypothetical protein